jgi:hypothetical protein
MKSNDIIQNELKEFNSLLADISRRNVYSVPDGYFDVLSRDILLGIQQTPIQVEDNGMVPGGYFEGLAGSIMQKIKEGITDEDESVLLKGLKNFNVYQVPAGYFDGLASGIINKLHPPAKVVVMQKRSSFFRYAAAAVITGFIGLSVISIFDKKGETDFIQPKTETAFNFDEAFSTLTDADIVSYLQKEGQDVNAALVASVSDDKSLPDQEDYLTDENTLDNLLNQLKAVESTTN